MANELTTIQISKEASEKLRALAETYKRSKSGHAEWLIEQDYRKLADVKLVGRVEPEAKPAESKAKKK
ncbi:MAG: hypothetical protein ACOYZ6_07905 [Chloroflexota bacterium]